MGHNSTMTASNTNREHLCTEDMYWINGILLSPLNVVFLSFTDYVHKCLHMGDVYRAINKKWLIKWISQPLEFCDTCVSVSGLEKLLKFNFTRIISSVLLDYSTCFLYHSNCTL